VKVSLEAQELPPGCGTLQPTFQLPFPLLKVPRDQQHLHLLSGSRQCHGGRKKPYPAPGVGPKQDDNGYQKCDEVQISSTTQLPMGNEKLLRLRFSQNRYHPRVHN
jgi:hypothetical protein